jgi:hypothetical protein
VRQGLRPTRACNHYVRLFTLQGVSQAGRSGNRSFDFGRFFLLPIAAAIVIAGCGVKTVYLHDGKQRLASIAVVVWSSPQPPADAPSIALAKIDDTKLEPHAAPVNRLEVMPGMHDFMVKASYPDPGAAGSHKPPASARATKGDEPAKFAVKGVSLSPGACYVVASDLLGDVWTEPVVRDARPTDPGFKFCRKR